MTGVALRQSRTELVIMALILAALAAYLVPTGLQQFAEYEDSGLKACLDRGRSCGGLRDAMVADYDRLGIVVGWFHVIPGIVGLLLAAPIVNEFEQRTYRLAWTQSITRERWLLTKIGVGLGGVLIFAVAFTAMHTWWYRPLDESVTLAGRDLGQSFGFEGVVPFFYTLFAFSLGLAAGALSRKMLVAMPVALVGFIAARLTLESMFRGLSGEAAFEAPGDGLASAEMTRDMERFWTIQAVESLIFVTASVLLLAVVYWSVRRAS